MDARDAYIEQLEKTIKNCQISLYSQFFIVIPYKKEIFRDYFQFYPIYKKKLFSVSCFSPKEKRPHFRNFTENAVVSYILFIPADMHRSDERWILPGSWLP